MRLRRKLIPRRFGAFGLANVMLALVAVLGATLLTLVNVPRALACPVCVSPDKVTLAGDGIAGTASVTDPVMLAWFSTAQFMGFEQRAPIAKPAYTGTGVEMTRYYKNSGVPASYWSVGFDHMRYYPGAPGKPGDILYESAVDAANNPFAQALNLDQRTGKWYALTSGEEQHMRQLLAVAQGRPLSSSDAPQPATSTGPSIGVQPPFSIQALRLRSDWLRVAILLAFILVLAAIVAYRVLRLRRHPSIFVVDEASGGELPSSVLAGSAGQPEERPAQSGNNRQ